MKKGKITRKNTSTKLQTKIQCFVSFFFFSFSFLSLFPFFLLSNPVLLVLLVSTSYSHLLHVLGAGRGRGVVSCAKSDDDSGYIYIYIIVVQRGPGNRLNRPKLCFLFVIVEIIRDCGQAGKEKLFFYFFGLWPYFE